MDSINRTLALSISGLILFIPACFLPLLELNIYGHTGSCTMIKGVLQMMKSGYWWMSCLVLFCSILVPFFIQMLLFGLSLALKLGAWPSLLVRPLKLYQSLTEWAMLDVYMLGILIALIKMEDYGDIFPGPGLYCFIGLLVLATLSILSFDAGLAWSLIERRTP
ncbi:MAG: paraquat-inducible protein A [Proteobacteria bacterium]|nr:paraquat-inducible protein A [Pseudomonadota bacterium]